MLQNARTPLRHDVPIQFEDEVKGICWDEINTLCCMNEGSVKVKAIIEKDVVRMDETIAIKLNVDLSLCKVDVEEFEIVLEQVQELRARENFVNYKVNKLIKISTEGAYAREIKEDIVAVLDLKKANDPNVPTNLEISLAKLTGKISQTCNGALVGC